MKRASLVFRSHYSPLRKWKVSHLVWTGSIISISVAFAALGFAVWRAVTSGDYHSILSHQSFTPFLTTGFAVIGALVASRYRRNPIGWIFLAVGLLYALLALVAVLIDYEPNASPTYQWAYWFGSWLWLPALFLPTTFVLLVFPDGHLPAPRWRCVSWSTALGLALMILVVMLHPGPLKAYGIGTNPLGVPGAAPILNILLNLSSALLAMGFLGSLAALTIRFRRSEGIERKQMTWLVYAVGLNLLCFILSGVAWFIWPAFPWKQEISILVSDLGILCIAIASAIAILRYHLYNIEILINRTLIYGILTAIVISGYVLLIGALSTLFQTSGSLWISLLATGLVALAFQPLRERLQHSVDRLMYGDRGDPYLVLSRLGQRLQSTLATEALLPAVVETIAQALKLPYVAISLRNAEDVRLAAEYGKRPASSARQNRPIDELVLPLLHQSETLGDLILVKPPNHSGFTAKDRRLLEDIARQAGAAVHAVQLTHDLKHSRELLVKSREEERRRLRRDLHDGLGPHLASLKLNMDVARNLVSRDPEAAEALLLDLRAQTQAAIANIRRLVYDLRPPALDELGFLSAMQEYARQVEGKDGLNIRFEGIKNLPPLTAAVEVAAYRITLEGLTNVVRHSHARKCCISISATDEYLQVELVDDGIGLPKNVPSGVGLNSMRERAEELGGMCVIESIPGSGTRVLARLPHG